MITINDLTIRQAKALGRALDVKGFSKLPLPQLREAIKMKEPDATKLQRAIDELLAPEAGQTDGKTATADEEQGGIDIESMTKDQLEQARLEALREIAKCSGRRMKTEDELRSRRETLNQEVSEAKANHKGAMERDVNYEDAASVRDKLEAVTEAWQSWNDALEHRRQELEPLKEKLSKARDAERKAFEESRQLKIKF